MKKLSILILTLFITTLGYSQTVTADKLIIKTVKPNTESNQVMVRNTTTGAMEYVDKNSISSSQINSDWNASSGVSNIVNKPIIDSGTFIANISSVSNGTIPIAYYNGPAYWTRINKVVTVYVQMANITVTSNGICSFNLSIPPISSDVVNSNLECGTGSFRYNSLSSPAVIPVQIQLITGSIKVSFVGLASGNYYGSLNYSYITN